MLLAVYGNSHSGETVSVVNRTGVDGMNFYMGTCHCGGNVEHNAVTVDGINIYGRTSVNLNA